MNEASNGLGERYVAKTFIIVGFWLTYRIAGIINCQKLVVKGGTSDSMLYRLYYPYYLHYRN